MIQNREEVEQIISACFVERNFNLILSMRNKNSHLNYTEISTRMQKLTKLELADCKFLEKSL